MLCTSLPRHLFYRSDTLHSGFKFTHLLGQGSDPSLGPSNDDDAEDIHSQAGKGKILYSPGTRIEDQLCIIPTQPGKRAMICIALGRLGGREVMLCMYPGKVRVKRDVLYTPR